MYELGCIVQKEDVADGERRGWPIMPRYGETNSGLAERVASLESRMDDQSDRVRRMENNVSTLLWMVAGTLIATVINLVLKIK